MYRFVLKASIFLMICQLRRKKYHINCLHFKKALKRLFLTPKNCPKLNSFFFLLLQIQTDLKI